MNINLLIDEKYVENAKLICNSIDDIEVRNRAVANVLASDISEKFFAGSSYEIDTNSGLHSMGAILEDIDISDIYINGHYVDVRLYFDDREISVPKTHFDSKILPVAYMFIKVSADLSSGVVRGFVLPSDIDTTQATDGFYPVDASTIKQFVEIAPYFMENHTERSLVNNADIFNYTEGSISEKIDFYRRLTQDYQGRIRLKQALKAQNVFNLISVNEDHAVEAEVDNPDFDDFTELLESDLDNSENNENSNSYEYTTEVSPRVDIDSLMNEPDTSENAENKETIDNLFTEESEIKEDSAETKHKVTTKKKSPVLLLLLILLLLGAAGYYGYTKFAGNTEKTQPLLPQNTPSQTDTISDKEDVMPVETVEKNPSINNQNEGISVSIPAIEHNLDASILVSNLKIEWEVPQGYIANSSAQRYLKKLGKILYLNLKTEMLLLNKPPITNKIVVELRYNAGKKTFETEKIVLSSGESSVDNVILQTINEVLNKKLSINSDIFSKIEGNPTLVIKL